MASATLCGGFEDSPPCEPNESQCLKSRRFGGTYQLKGGCDYRLVHLFPSHLHRKRFEDICTRRYVEPLAQVPLWGEAHVFAVTCSDEAGRTTVLKLAGASEGEMQSWITALRSSSSTEAKQDEGMSSRAAIQKTQDDSLEALSRITRMLEDSQAVAVKTGQELDQQAEQLAEIDADLGKMNAAVRRADRNFNSLERWRIFGGKSGQRAPRISKGKVVKTEKLKDDHLRSDKKTPAVRSAPSGFGETTRVEVFDVTTGLTGRDK